MFRSLVFPRERHRNMPTIPSVIFFRESFPEIYRKRPRGPTTTCSVLQRNKPTENSVREANPPGPSLGASPKERNEGGSCLQPFPSAWEAGNPVLGGFRSVGDGTEITVDFLGIFPKWKDVFGESNTPSTQEVGAWRLRPKSISQRQMCQSWNTFG